MQTQAPQTPDLAGVVTAIRREYETLDRWLSAISPAYWEGPTNCTEWTVRQVVSHLGSGAEIHLLTIQEQLDGAAPVTPEVRQRIWSHFDSLAPDALYRDFRGRNLAYLSYLEGLPPDRRERTVKFFMGERPVAGYAVYRLFELSLHSWDIRVGLDPTVRLLPTSVAPLWSVLAENVNRRAKAEAKTELNGTVWGIAVHGPVERQMALVVRDGTVALTDAPPSPPAALLRLPAEAFIRLVSGRLPLEAAEAAGEVAIAGDRATVLRLNQLFAGF
jgi:uncharacterized protein (TIGR03083 family)